MGSCRKGEYTTNEVVVRMPFICWGGFGQPVCPHLALCAGENGISGFRVKQAKKRNAPRNSRREAVKGNPHTGHDNPHSKSLGI